MSDPILYSKVDGPPNDWMHLQIIDLPTDAEVNMVIEVNAAEGWLIRYKTDDKGRIVLDKYQDEAARERIEGRFEIRRPA